jgi:hypothetical protein
VQKTAGGFALGPSLGQGASQVKLISFRRELPFSCPSPASPIRDDSATSYSFKGGCTDLSLAAVVQLTHCSERTHAEVVYSNA